MLCSCSQSKPTSSFAPVSSHGDARYSSLNPDVGFLFILGRSRIARSGRSRVCVSSRLSDVKLVAGRGATCLRQRYGENRFGGRPERRSGRDRGRIAAAGESSMWITAANAVALVVALALFAAFGGFLLSMAAENEAREEVLLQNIVCSSLRN